MQNTDKMRHELATLAKSGANIKDEKLELWTAPYDPRFPNQNQTRYCYQMYVDFHRCKKARGEDYDACQYFKKCYKSLCPIEWVEKWDEQIAENRFPGRI